MATFAELTSQDKARLEDLTKEAAQLVRQLKGWRSSVTDYLRRYDRNKALLPSDRTGTTYILDTNSSPQRVELTRIISVFEDLLATVNRGLDQDGASHTRVTATDTELTTWLDDYYERNLG